MCSYALTLLISLPHRSQGYTFIAFRATKGYAEEATDAIYLLLWEHVSFFEFSANNLIVGLPSWIAREYLDDLFSRLVSSRSEKYFASSSTGLIWLPQYGLCSIIQTSRPPVSSTMMWSRACERCGFKWEWCLLTIYGPSSWCTSAGASKVRWFGRPTLASNSSDERPRENISHRPHFTYELFILWSLWLHCNCSLYLLARPLCISQEVD